MKILIADDDLTSRTMLQAILTKWGFQVTVAINGEEAWVALSQKDAPQFLILDWMMPRMDGLSLCRKVRSDEQIDPLYIILLTSKDKRRNVIKGLDAGADDYITKPYDNGELRARINAGCRVLELHNMLRQQERLTGVLEMAGAVCHELSQPIQAVSAWTELLLMEIGERNPTTDLAAALHHIMESVNRMGMLTQKIMDITTYQTVNYLGGNKRIVDIERASTA